MYNLEDIYIRMTTTEVGRQPVHAGENYLSIRFQTSFPEQKRLLCHLCLLVNLSISHFHHGLSIKSVLEFEQFYALYRICLLS